MRLAEARAYRGPNPHASHPVIQGLLDVEASDAARLALLRDALLQALPHLRAHPCDRECPLVVAPADAAGHALAHLVEHVARELLRLAGQERSWGRTCPTRQPGLHRVAYAHDEEESGLAALHEAVALAEALAQGLPADVAGAAARLAALRREGLPGPSTASIVEEARRRGIPVLKLEDGYWQLGHGARQQRIEATLTGRTGAIGVGIADDKQRTKRLLAKAGVPVAGGDAVRTLEGALEVARELGWPVVLKPLVGNHGRGITVGVRSPEEMAAAFARAQQAHPRVLVERMLAGSDFRLLVIGHRFVAAARRDPAQVRGDGVRTVAQLVEAENADPRRGDGHENVLSRIVVDDATLALLARQGISLDAVPEAGRVVLLKTTANLSTGGTATDVTDEVHPDVREMAERISHVVGLDVCGVDVVAPHLRAPLEETGGGVCEVNAAPGFRMHLAPSAGRPRDVAAPVVDALFPRGETGRIPIVAVTGTNGKTTTARLVAHVLHHEGHRVGLACTTSVEVHGRRVLTGDYSGPAGAEAVLTDPTVTHAVLEVARGGILRRGLGFDACDVGILLNVESDHLGLDGVDTLEDLAHVKATVVRGVRPGGTAVLNAEDPLSLAAQQHARGPVILFSLHPDAPAYQAHLDEGGTGVTLEGDHLVVHHGRARTRLVAVHDVPITMGGRAPFNVANALAATAAALALHVPLPHLARALTTFHPSPAQLPGRLNVFDKEGVRVVVDYGHNPAAVRALGEFVQRVPARRRICAASGTGNRRDEDLRAFGACLAHLYDHVVLSDPDPRGRAPMETPLLVKEGALAAGLPDAALQIEPDEETAIRRALDLARPSDLVVLQAEDIHRAIALAQAFTPAHVLPPAEETRAQGKVMDAGT